MSVHTVMDIATMALLCQSSESQYCMVEPCLWVEDVVWRPIRRFCWFWNMIMSSCIFISHCSVWYMHTQIVLVNAKVYHIRLSAASQPMVPCIRKPLLELLQAKSTIQMWGCPVWLFMLNCQIWNQIECSGAKSTIWSPTNCPSTLLADAKWFKITAIRESSSLSTSTACSSLLISLPKPWTRSKTEAFSLHFLHDQEQREMSAVTWALRL